MDDAEDRSWAPLLLAHPLPGCSMNRHGAEAVRAEARLRPPHIDGVQSTDFSHTVEFSRSLVGSLFATPLWFPIRSRRRSGGHRILGLPGSSTERPVTPGYPRGSHRSLSRSRTIRRSKRRRPNGPPSTQRWVVPPVFPGVPPSTLPAFRFVPPPWATDLRGHT